jgi:hypothetical protein
LETVIATTAKRPAGPVLRERIETDDGSEDDKDEEKCLFHEFYTYILPDYSMKFKVTGAQLER